MAPSITLLQAIETWLAGQEVDRNAILWGLDVTWWSRIAKLGQLLAGATALIDILGAEKIRSWGSKFLLHGPSKLFSGLLVVSAFGGIWWMLSTFFPSLRNAGMEGLLDKDRILPALVASALFLLALGVIEVLLWAIAKGLSYTRSARFLRIAAFVVFVLSVGLDLLTS